MPRKPRVRFVYRTGSRYLGSTLMRCHQMLALARRALSDKYDLGAIALPRLALPFVEQAWVALQPAGTTYIFVKNAIDRLSPECLCALQTKAAGIALDYVDRHLHIMPRRGIDLHIACSFAAKAAMTERIARLAGTTDAVEGDVGLLLHGADLRLEGLRVSALPDCRPVFFGSPHVTFMSDRIAREVNVIDVTTTEKMAASFRQIVDYNLHYCVRKTITYAHERGYKPFTKGATAAAVGAVVLTHADEDDVLDYVGPDYPFLCRSNDEAEIYEMLQKCKRSYRGQEWRAAEGAMQRIRDMTGPEAQVRQLASLIERLRG